MNAYPRGVRFAVFIVLGILLLHIATMFSEWWSIGVIADPDDLAEYHFGSEPMLHHGGSHYESAEVYAAAMLREGLVACAAAVGIIVGHARRSIWLVVTFVLLFTVWVAVGFPSHAP
jgi:hypothetical protein